MYIHEVKVYNSPGSWNWHRTADCNSVDRNYNKYEKLYTQANIRYSEKFRDLVLQLTPQTSQEILIIVLSE